MLGDPTNALLAMRLPLWKAETPADLQLIGPPAAVRAEITRDGVSVATVPLNRRVGRFTLPGPAEVTVRAIDARGARVAEPRLSDDIGARRLSSFEPEVRGW